MKKPFKRKNNCQKNNSIQTGTLSPQNKRICILWYAETDKDLLSDMGKMLKRNYTIQITSSFIEAINIIDKGEMDLVIPQIVKNQKSNELLNQYVKQKKINDIYSGDDFMKCAIECVNRHVQDFDFSLNCFVNEMHSKKATCFRKLKMLTGLSYTSFVRKIRLEIACRIMKEKEQVSINEVAYAVGYNDPRYFSQCFKKEYGMLPSTYINNIR